MKNKSRRAIMVFLLAQIFLISSLVVGLSSQPGNNANWDLSPRELDLSQISSRESLERENFERSSIINQEIPSSEKWDSSLARHLSMDQRGDSFQVFYQICESLSYEQRKRHAETLFPKETILRIYENLPFILVETSLSNLEQSTSHNLVERVFLNERYELMMGDEIEMIGEKHTEPITIQSPMPQPSSSPESELENWWLPLIGADSATKNGAGVNIAIIDTGITIHPDFIGSGEINPETGEYSISGNENRRVMSVNFADAANALEKRHAFDTHGHGTFCAGIAAGSGKLSDGEMRGVAPGANLYNLRIFDSEGGSSTQWLLDAFDWLLQSDVDIVSMSIGGFLSQMSALMLATERLTKQGISLFAAAGNSGPSYYSIQSPALLPYVMSVGAVDQEGLVSFSSIGPGFDHVVGPDFVAPGREIFSTSAHKSMMDFEADLISARYFVQDEFGYTIASGTSMATPMVAGVAALLKQEFPTLNPFALRVALHKGAEEVDSYYGYGTDQGIGAGLVNYPNSQAYLETIATANDGDPNQAVGVFYDQVPYDPKDLLTYPGETQRFNLTLISGYAGDFTLELPDLPGINLEISNTSLTFETADSLFFGLNISIADNAIPGVYSDSILIKENGNVVDEVEVNITIRLPQARVYFDTYHNLFDLPGTTQTLVNYYLSLKYLNNLDYCVDIESTFYRPSTYANFTGNFSVPSLIHEGRLGVDILLLAEPRLAFSPEEMDAIKTFYEEGGSILILPSDKTRTCIDSVNQLLAHLEVDIQYSEENLRDVVDFISPFAWLHKVTELNDSHPVFMDVEAFSLTFGHYIETTEDQSIAKYRDETVVAAHNGTAEGKGKVLAFTDGTFLQNRGFAMDSDDYQHVQLLENVFEYLKPSEELALNLMQIRENDTAADLNFTLSVVNTTISQGITDLPAENLNLTVLSADENYRVELNFTESGNGMYYNDEFIFSEEMSSPDPYRLIVNLSIDGTYYERIFYAYYYNSSIDFGYYNGTLFGDLLTRENSANVSSILFNSTNPNTSLDFHFTSVPTSVFSQYSARNFTLKAFWDEDMNAYNTSMELPADINAGTLMFYGDQRDSLGYRNLNPGRWRGEIINYRPVINLQESYFGGVQLSSLIQADGVSILYGNPGNYSLEISTTEIVDFEDQPEDLEVTVSLILTTIYGGYLYPIFPEEDVYFDLPYDTDEGIHQGSIELPQTLSYSNFSREGTFEIFDQDRLYVLLFVSVLDRDGGGTSEIILMYLTYKDYGQLNDYTTLLAVQGGLIAIIGISAYISKKDERDLRQNQLYRPSYSSRPSIERAEETRRETSQEPVIHGRYKECPNCGNQVDKRAMLCINCGHSFI